ncbi:SDR family NAD(P)-dependent oxidoreductase [Amycolatopsis echigonensis]|uniref:Glucose 1-dehydrogenase n=1 Tax=Amycolatopsis echigonensis TaxID=2576905 RepID=A0A8E1W212_9PSEU|nr:glucose 1-dehydrogenase [Amycolatopsis echigonensis]MBB2502340.1 glucose 1-dehydrogenase [Amycolatopsis echigonensis]
MNRFRLDGKVAIVTGASSGLGVAFALALAEAGAAVVLGARREDQLRETARAAGKNALAVRTDVTRVADCDALAAAAMDKFGRVDVLINNAGTGGKYLPATEDPPEQFRSVVELNLFGAYWMAQACGRVMGPGSSVVNISSVMALTTAKMPAAGYSASKAGVLGLTRDLAAQWGPRGIRVNALLPGVFPSEATAHYSENYQRKIIDAKIPLGRIGDPADVAAAAVFLASDASAYITGVSLPVDGGVLIN